ncbi:ribonuclease Z [Galbibacter pacificus]|uniref:Ribonuclease Z n=1 Tax=Galbibacter pacificus TaxID=2996052 RepID=A0ABT6FUQ7_9FLAO|nr:ribonuclease Z [Galbibacter pacificus]MDG3583527.1 ribonuclease Z [Galbibacter pacificus]MDG3586997.1 ribonuclease Z [Galbibacter pacificus]
MIIDRQENTTVITQENVSLGKFIDRLDESYPKYKNDHLILNLLSLSKLTANDLMEFLELSRDHRKAGKSFVIVTDTVNYNDVHEELVVAPTLKEAYDVIEMEDIERDLDF